MRVGIVSKMKRNYSRLAKEYPEIVLSAILIVTGIVLKIGNLLGDWTDRFAGFMFFLSILTVILRIMSCEPSFPQ